MVDDVTTQVDHDDNADTGDDAGSGASKETEWTPPTKDEWERTKAALAKANGEARDNRLKLRDAKQASEDADSKAAREAAEAAEKRLKPVAVRSAARAAFLEAGLTDAKPERVAKLLRMLDLDELDITDDGEVAGLDEQVTAIKADYPELFAKSKQGAPRIDGSDRKPGSSTQPKTTGEKIAAQLIGATR